MKINYFIDSENVGDSWVSLLTAADEDDELLVFYTLKSPHMNYKNVVLLKQSPKEVCFIECSGGNNGLDFQLCTELGFRISKCPDDDYIIFSNDTGFDAVVKYWVARGIHVSRAKSRIDPAPQQKVTEKETQAPAVNVTAAAKAPAEKAPLQKDAKKQDSQPDRNAAKKNTENAKKEKPENGEKNPSAEKQNGKSGQNQKAAAPVQEKKQQKKKQPVSQPADAQPSPKDSVKKSAEPESASVPEKAAESAAWESETVHTVIDVPAETPVQADSAEIPDVKESAVSAETESAPQAEAPAETGDENVQESAPEQDTAPAQESAPEPDKVSAQEALPSGPEQPVSEEKLPEKAASETVITEDMTELLYCVGKDDLATLHEALKQIYGDERCKAIYKAFKPETAYKDFLAEHVELSVEEKQELYCRILFYVQVPEKNIPEDFRSFLMSSWTKKKNLNSLRAMLLEHYGKDAGSEYYNLVKAHVKILDTFK